MTEQAHTQPLYPFLVELNGVFDVLLGQAMHSFYKRERGISTGQR
jgi:hypothetical protein